MTPTEAPTKPKIRKGPPTEQEAAYGLHADLKNMSHQTKRDVKALMFDRDLEDLEPAQGMMIKRWVVMNRLAARDAVKFQNWLQSDEKFKLAVWKRRISRLEFHGMEVDDALATKAKNGAERSMMIYYQITGKMPVGGKMIETPSDGYENLTDAELAKRSKELDDDMAKLRGESIKRKRK